MGSVFFADASSLCNNLSREFYCIMRIDVIVRCGVACLFFALGKMHDRVTGMLVLAVTSFTDRIEPVLARPQRRGCDGRVANIGRRIGSER